MLRKNLLTICLLALTLNLVAQLKSPSEFLPHELGQQFTGHSKLVDYVEYVADESPVFQLTTYGMTAEDRPLLLGFISSEENLGRLEAIRKNNLIQSGLEEGSMDEELSKIAIIWLSFGVHGNEAGCPESSMQVLYELANTSNQRTQAWLKNTVVLFDPSLNPDGYARYANWYRQVANKRVDPLINAWEHREPWPGGRTNHYYFDLNRDWAWQTQAESQQRIKVYHQWMPHIHVDYHEQGYNSPYYFAPAAKPFHEYITDWQVDFQTTIGKNHAKYFDENGWLYFTRELFDLLYPSYGDTWPSFNGAIGMTHEQAGHGVSGRGIIMENGDTLTLKDRVDHHTVTALSNVEMASLNAGALNEQFRSYFQKAISDPVGTYKTFIIKGDNPTGRLKAFCEMLDKNGIIYGTTKPQAKIGGFEYLKLKDGTVNVSSEDIIISAYQARSVLAQTLLEPEPKLEDSITYDITAWALPYAFGLEAFATDTKMEVTPGYQWPEWNASERLQTKPYGYLIRWNSLQDAQFLSNILNKGVKVRFAAETLKIQGATYKEGTLVITRADNRKMGDRFFKLVENSAKDFQPDIVSINSGFSDNGKDLGSGNMRFMQKPKIALLGGESTSSGSFGQTWHFFEQVMDYPVSIFHAKDFGGIPLDAYNVLILPSGRYQMSESQLDKLNRWVSQGGNLIAIESAVRSLVGKKGFELKQYATDEEKKQAKSAAEKASLDRRLNPYGDQELEYISRSIPGAIFKLDMDDTHPLAFGLGDHYFSLKTNTLNYKFQTKTWNIGTIKDEPKSLGFVGEKVKEHLKETTVFAVQEKGRGSVTYLIDNPLFRGFWQNGQFLFSNAVFFVGQD